MANKFIAKGTFRAARSTITFPENSGLRLIINPIDLAGKVDNVTNVSLAAKWANSKDDARRWYREQVGFKLGEFRTVAVQSDVWIVNTVLFDKDGKHTDSSLEVAMKKIAALAKFEKASLHVHETLMNIAGFKETAQKLWLDEGINVWVYTAQKKVPDTIVKIG